MLRFGIAKFLACIDSCIAHPLAVRRQSVDSLLYMFKRDRMQRFMVDGYDKNSGSNFVRKKLPRRRLEGLEKRGLFEGLDVCFWKVVADLLKQFSCMLSVSHEGRSATEGEEDLEFSRSLR